MNTIVNRIKIFLLLSVVLWLAFQTFHEESLFSAEPLQEEEKPEVISLLGKKLYAAPAEGEELLKLQNELKEAIKKVEADPENPEHLIMYGRRLAYLWKYHDAIDVYTRGIKIHPDQAMLYRHRGHRYISIRKFDLAVKDLTKASELNDHDFDIWYHLGLAHYLNGEFENALGAYQNCLKSAQDDDAKIAISNWLYITLRRLGKKEEAAEVLDKIKEGMGVVENQSYYDLLFFYKGLKSEAEIEALAEVSDLDMATIGYGIGCWHLYNNNSTKAKVYFEKIMKGRYWPAFGFIAAEAELFRLKE
ncbi:MAG: tetratricopeptide repeat protein [Candidatus Aminicenantes bacterium]|nr:tetratricopeptide repeat protein [Candidatus Aminicenantes bacterium]